MKLDQVQDRQVIIIYLDNKYYLQISKQKRMFSTTVWGIEEELIVIGSWLFGRITFAPVKESTATK